MGMAGPVVGCPVMLLATVSNRIGQVAENDRPPVVAQPALPSSPIVNPEPAPATLAANPGQEGQDGQGQKEAGGPEKLAALETAVTDLSKKLTVVTAGENFKLILGG